MFKIKNDTSASYNLNMTDVNKILRDAGMVGLGAGVVYLLNNISDLHLGTGSVIGITVILNVLYKWIKDNSPQNMPNPYQRNRNPYNRENQSSDYNDFKPDFYKPDFYKPDKPDNTNVS